MSAKQSKSDANGKATKGVAHRTTSRSDGSHLRRKPRAVSSKRKGIVDDDNDEHDASDDNQADDESETTRPPNRRSRDGDSRFNDDNGGNNVIAVDGGDAAVADRTYKVFRSSNKYDEGV